MLTLGLSGAIVFLGYIAFGLTGFGSSIIAIPLLAQIIPLKLAVPMMLLMDMVAGFFVGAKNSRDIDRAELKGLAPWIALGMIAGLPLLVNAPEPILLAVLGVFAIVQAVRNLFFKPSYATIHVGWRIVYGSIGGVFTSLFGTGGPLYVVYLGRRIREEARRRATIAVLIWLTAFARLVLFMAAGLMWQPELFTLITVCLPLSLLGAYSGSRLRRRLKVSHLNQMVWVIVGVAGVSLLIRYSPGILAG